MISQIKHASNPDPLITNELCLTVIVVNRDIFKSIRCNEYLHKAYIKFYYVLCEYGHNLNNY